MSEIINLQQGKCIESNECMIWPLVNKELDKDLAIFDEELADARRIDNLRAQQQDDSDGAHFDVGELADVEFKVEIGKGLVEGERRSMRERTIGCDGKECLLAAYCVARTVKEDLK